MLFERYLYYALLVTAFALSLVKSKRIKRLGLISLLLFFSILSEISSDYFRYIANTNRYAPYHFYIPIEYSLVTLYYSYLIPINWVKKLLIITIPVFIISSLLISLYGEKIYEFPSWQYNMDGSLIIIWSVIGLFNLPFNPEKSIFRRSQFWFCIAFMILFSGQFFMNGFFNPLNNSNPDLTKKLIFIIYYTLNYLFYSLIIVGLLCSKPTRKYITQ